MKTEPDPAFTPSTSPEPRALGQPALSAESPMPTGRSTIASRRLYDLLEQHRNRRFVLVRPGGNWGDHLIYNGMFKIADQLGIEYEDVDHDVFQNRRFDKDLVLYIHGGGGYVPWVSGRAVTAFQKAVCEHAGMVIVGPTSFLSDRKFLMKMLVPLLKKRTARELVLYARDPYSLDVIRDVVADRARVDLDHDTALNLDRAELLACADLAPDYQPRRRYVCYAIRTDAEAANIGAVNPFRVPVDPRTFCWSFPHWVRLHANASRLITNRLHSAIAGSVLGVRTSLLPNCYHKNRGVWEQSLQSRGVEWMPRLPASYVASVCDATGFTQLAFKRRIVERTLARLCFGRLGG